jgi:hypothetical protein
MSCITCETWTDLEVRKRWAGTATPLARGVPCLVARRRFNSQLDGDESAKGFWWRCTRQPDKQPDRDRADTLTACLKRPGFGKPGFCGTD